MDFSNHPLNHRYNVIDNESKTLTNNVIVNVAQADAIADKLARALNNPDGRLFYCKVAWRLPEARIWNNLEIAQTGRNPRNYFTWLCKREMRG